MLRNHRAGAEPRGDRGIVGRRRGAEPDDGPVEPDREVHERASPISGSTQARSRYRPRSAKECPSWSQAASRSASAERSTSASTIARLMVSASDAMGAPRLSSCSANSATPASAAAESQVSCMPRTCAASDGVTPLNVTRPRPTSDSRAPVSACDSSRRSSEAGPDARRSRSIRSRRLVSPTDPFGGIDTQREPADVAAATGGRPLPLQGVRHQIRVLDREQRERHQPARTDEQPLAGVCATLHGFPSHLPFASRPPSRLPFASPPSRPPFAFRSPSHLPFTSGSPSHLAVASEPDSAHCHRFHHGAKSAHGGAVGVNPGPTVHKQRVVGRRAPDVGDERLALAGQVGRTDQAGGGTGEDRLHRLQSRDLRADQRPVAAHHHHRGGHPEGAERASRRFQQALDDGHQPGVEHAGHRSARAVEPARKLVTARHRQPGPFAQAIADRDLVLRVAHREHPGHRERGHRIAEIGDRTVQGV